MDRPQIIVQSIGDTLHHWILVRVQEDLPESKKNILSDMSSYLIQQFFDIKRGDTDKLRLLCKQYLNELKSLLPNLFIDKKGFTSAFEEQFNSYNSESILMQCENARDLLKKVKSNFTFNDIVLRFLLPDLIIDHEEQIYLEKMMKTHNYSQKELFENFVATFKCFIDGYSPVVETYISDCVEKMTLELESSYQMIRKSVKNRLVSYIDDILSSLKFQKISIQVQEIPGNAENSNWVVAYENYIVDESAHLKQVIRFSPYFFLITIALEVTNKLLLISYKEFISSRIKHIFDDKETIIAAGSVPQSLIIFKNTSKECWIGILSEKKIELTKKLEIYSERVKEVISGIYIKHENHIIYIYSPGAIGQYTKSSPKNFSNIYPQVYNQILISECERFIILVSEENLVVYNTKLKILHQESIRCVHCVIIDFTLKIVTCDENSNLSVVVLQLNPAFFEERPKIKAVYDSFNTSARKSIGFGKSFIKNLLSENYLKKVANGTTLVKEDADVKFSFSNK
jgi:hypothetical protein